MKKLNDLISKIGGDKVMHFLVGMVVVANFALLGGQADFNRVLMGGLIGVVVNVVLQLAKEWWLDDEVDYADVVYGGIGGFVELLICLVVVLVF